MDGNKNTFHSKVYHPRNTWITKTFANRQNIYYHPRMQTGNNFTQICLSVCLSICLSAQAITFKWLKPGTSFLVYGCILIISRSNLSIKVMGLRLRSNLFFCHILLNHQLYVFLFHSNMIKGQGHLKLTVKDTFFPHI